MCVCVEFFLETLGVVGGECDTSLERSWSGGYEK